MDHIIGWLKATGWPGVPHGVLLFFGALVGVEYALPRLKNPRARSLGELAANGVGLLLGRFPLLGPIAQKLALVLGTPQAAAETAKPSEPTPASKISSLLPLLLLPVLLASGCAPTSAYVTARKAEETASVTLQASYATWRDYDRAHQQQIVGASLDLNTAKEVLSQWRSGVQSKVDEAFIAARQAVAAMDATLGAADATMVKDYSTAIAKLLGAMAQLGAILQEYGVVPAPPTSKPTALMRRAWSVLFVCKNPFLRNIYTDRVCGAAASVVRRSIKLAHAEVR